MMPMSASHGLFTPLDARRIALCAALTLASTAAFAQVAPSAGTSGARPTDAQVAARVDEYMMRLENLGYTGGVLVIRDGRVLVKRSYGMANRASGIVADSATVYNLGSITKQFTAAAILRLQEQGKLDVKVMSPSIFIAGKTISLRVQVLFNATVEPEAVVTIKIIGTAFKPQVFIGWYGSVPLEDFKSLLAPGSYERRQSYQPADQVAFSQELSLKPNRSQPVAVPLGPAEEHLSPGLYELRLDAPGLTAKPSPYLMVVSNVHLTS